MTNINMSSIMNKAQKGMNNKLSKISKSESGAAIQSQDSLDLARNLGEKFVEELHMSINSTPGLDGIAGLLRDITAECPDFQQCMAKQNGENKKLTYWYTININFNGERHRDSLDPERYPDGVHDIIALFDQGYHARKSVYGTWHGEKIHSKTERPPARFCDNAINAFQSKYSDKCGFLHIFRGMDFSGFTYTSHAMGWDKRFE